MNTDHFKNLTLIPALLRTLAEEGYKKPTPVQDAAIPLVLAGKDLMAAAQTGTGKTAAFALPILQMLYGRSSGEDERIRALILTPTRELALQVEESFRCYGRHIPLQTTAVIGGVSSARQIKALKKNPDILVATPGRLLDLFEQGHIFLGGVEMFVLDEADRMLDMGFMPSIRMIVEKLPMTRQTMLFSATISEEIAEMASRMLKKPARVEAAPPASVADNIDQKVLFVEHGDKQVLLADILKKAGVGRTLVFARTKRRADRIMRQLSNQGITADAIHSNKTQNARQRALAAFGRGKIKVLVGTDIVARGIDVDGISHVINYDMPNNPDSYVHRIGRTARAGASGIALSFCDAGEVEMLKDIERLTRHTLAAFEDHPFHSSDIAALHERKAITPGVRFSPGHRFEDMPAGSFGRRPVHRRPR